MDGNLFPEERDRATQPPGRASNQCRFPLRVSQAAKLGARWVAGREANEGLGKRLLGRQHRGRNQGQSEDRQAPDALRQDDPSAA